jgi:hypothetical protein
MLSLGKRSTLLGVAGPKSNSEKSYSIKKETSTEIRGSVSDTENLVI